MTDKPLRKPDFITIDKLSRGRSGYNIYAKVIKAEVGEINTKDGQKIPMVHAVIADQTAAAHAFFKGENTELIKVGNVISIRNGVKKIIKKHISLQVDLFGRVLPEKMEIKEKTDVNISEEEIDYDKINKDNRDNRGNQGRRFNNRNTQRNNPRRRDFKDNRNNRFNNNRDREDRGDRGDRGDRKERGDNKNFRSNRPNRPKRDDLDYDRKPTQGGSRYQQKKTGGGHHEQKRGQRVPLIKISEIDPGADKLRFIAKVISATLVPGKNYDSLRCVLGDETGLVNAFLAKNDSIAVGQTIILFNAEARVVKEHIEIQRAKVEKAKNEIKKVKDDHNISDKAWVPVD